MTVDVSCFSGELLRVFPDPCAFRTPPQSEFIISLQEVFSFTAVVLQRWLARRRVRQRNEWRPDVGSRASPGSWPHLVEPSSSTGGTSAQPSGSGAAERLDSFLLLKVMKCSLDKLTGGRPAVSPADLSHLFQDPSLGLFHPRGLVIWILGCCWTSLQAVQAPAVAQDCCLFALVPYWNGGMSVLLLGGFLTSFAAVFFLCGCDSSSRAVCQ